MMSPYVIKYNPDSEILIYEGCYILEMSNTGHDNAVSIARARLPVGIKTRLHSLKDTVERYVILQGKGLMLLGDREQTGGQIREQIIVEPGDVVYIPSGCPQAIENIGDCELIFLAVCTPRFVPESYEDLS